MLKNKSILAISILITTLGITACQPKKTEPETVEPEQTQAEQQSLKLVGDTEKLNLSLPKCEGNNCPEISIERLNSNQAFIDHFIDQKIIQELAQILEIAPQQAVSEAAAIENAATAADAAGAHTGKRPWPQAFFLFLSGVPWRANPAVACPNGRQLPSKCPASTTSRPKTCAFACSSCCRSAPTFRSANWRGSWASATAR